MTLITRRLFTTGALALTLVALTPNAFAQKGPDVEEMLKTLDARQRALGDYKATVYMEQSKKGESKLVYLATTYRREGTEQFVFLFTKPRTEAGKGYLRIDRNIFLFDPAVGKWERRTERERIGGTDSTRQDFDVKNLARDYTGEYVGKEKLGKRAVHHLKLTARKNAKVAFPSMHLWLDVATGNMLKQQDFSLSGKLMRTLYYPKWEKYQRPNGGGEVEMPREIRILDELQKGNQTTIVIQEVELNDLPDNIFTKAWLESKSR